MKPSLDDLLICDDVRREDDGRLSLMGVHTGATVVVHQLPTIISQLSFVLRFSGLERELELSSRIKAPDGHEAHPAPGRKLAPQTQAGEALYVLQAAPIQISVAGWHELHIKLGATTLKTGFRVVQPDS
ncbi:hypothetical protein [Thioalkalivibrio sp. AKL10]|uniref:DUF6941 family protein n=1 Tax=Thioalkalivibrio sp. AKL10 TaxID=1158158 RepID=UPI00036331C4|nr:hypothetical protein [Thioalkalivibrio sp. AKL10]